MIVLKISNAQEVVASKLGRLLAQLAGEAIDLTKVEDKLIDILIANLGEQGIKGEVVAVKGLDFDEKALILHEQLHVRSHQRF